MFDLTALQFVNLLAQSDSTRMPAPKAALLLVLCAAIGLGSLAGVFASAERLQQYSGIIGTSNPWVARIACLLGVLVGFLGALAFAASLLGYLD